MLGCGGLRDKLDWDHACAEVMPAVREHMHAPQQQAGAEQNPPAAGAGAAEAADPGKLKDKPPKAALLAAGAALLAAGVPKDRPPKAALLAAGAALLAAAAPKERPPKAADEAAGADAAGAAAEEAPVQTGDIERSSHRCSQQVPSYVRRLLGSLGAGAAACTWEGEGER